MTCCNGPLSPWHDPDVKAALKSRNADDIMLIDCPHCGMASYYNQGSHFTCRCGRGFEVIGDDESPPERPFVSVSDAYPLSDWEEFGVEEWP